eukprot:TRINITY_DN40651_c0_g1_i1.p1 TRINITY_DN40651_c0_g1~~TRINITY_DN40651_c0_g1_i1.p1  ORF type:complete len:270 (-),score=45.29 TRINITY_DN40651_c0_g1_i1:33-842(-)
MAVFASAKRMLHVVGIGGCTERDRDKEESEHAKSLRPVAKPSKHAASEATPSTTLGSPRSVSAISIGSASCRSTSGYGGTCFSSRLSDGHWLLEHERLAFRPEDLELLSIFLKVYKVPSTFACSKNAKLMLTTLRFLHSLDLGLEDICCIMAHAGAYFGHIDAACGSSMNREEVANVLVLLMYLAHCHILDETCHLQVWHRYLFKNYCNLPTLSKATMQLMRRLNYKLRIGDEELKQNLPQLLQVVRWKTGSYFYEEEESATEGPITAI